MFSLIILILAGASMVIISIFFMKQRQRKIYFKQNGLMNGKEFVRTYGGYANFKDDESIKALRRGITDDFSLPPETQELRRQSVDSRRRDERLWEI